MRTAADNPMNVWKKKEDLTGNCAHSIVQNCVMKNKYFVSGGLMKLVVEDQAHVETKNSIDGDREPRPNLKLNAQDTVLLRVKHTKSCALHSETLVTAAQQNKYAERPSKMRMVFSALERKKKERTHKIPLFAEGDFFLTPTTAPNSVEKRTGRFCVQHMRTQAGAKQKPNAKCELKTMMVTGAHRPPFVKNNVQMVTSFANTKP